MTESELIRLCQQASPRGQQELFDRWADSLYRVALRYVKTDVDAEDIVMISFTKAFRHITSFRPQGEGSLHAWLRKIVVNESLGWLRRRHNFNMVESLDDTLPVPDLNEVCHLPAEDILRLVMELPAGYRTVFNLHVVEGYSHQEIAEQLGISESTARTQLFKAKAQLKKMLIREGFQYGT